MKKIILIALIVVVLTVSCARDEPENKKEFGIFIVLDDNSTVKMDGDISSTSLSDFKKLEKEFPNVKTINIVNCDGSLDDETNLKLSKLIHDKGINTHVLDNGVIASGGVDFFLAGHKRTIGENVKIGVHSWSGSGETATDYPKGSEEHMPYINYYKSVGFTQTEAEDFYYFTINSATADGIHYMTEGEIQKYKVITE